MITPRHVLTVWRYTVQLRPSSCDIMEDIAVYPSRPHSCLLLVFMVLCGCLHSLCVITLPCSSFSPVCCIPSSVLLRQYRFKFTPSVVLLSLCCCCSLSLPLSLYAFIYSSHSLRASWQIFKEQLHTRVVLVAVEIWTDKDQIPISVRPLEMLRDFSKYRQQSIKHHADAVHLFS